MSFIITVVSCRQSSISLNLSFFFFFNDPATTEIYTLSLHDALPISSPTALERAVALKEETVIPIQNPRRKSRFRRRSEEHTSELQSHSDLVCRLLLEKKKKKQQQT